MDIFLKTINLIFCFWVLLVITGCSSKEINYIDLQNDTIAKIQIDSGVIKSINKNFQPYGSENIYIYEETNQTLACLNIDQQSVNFFFSLKNNIEVVEFFIEEQDRKVYFINEDSILTYNLEGEFLSRISLNNDKGFLTILKPYFKPIYENGIWYFHFFPDIEETFQSAEFFKQPIEAEFNVENLSVSTINQSYPYEYINSCFGYDFVPERLKVDSRAHGYTFPHNDSIYILNMESNYKKTAFFGSRRAKEFIHIDYLDIPNLNANVFNEMFTKSASYYFSSYAPLAKKYYRNFFPGIPDSSNKKHRNSYLIIYDENLNYIGETKEYYQSGIVVDSKDGLMAFSKHESDIIFVKLF